MNASVALCLEQTLGHRAHSETLEASAARSGRGAHAVHVEYESGRLPWALRGSWQAYQKLTHFPPAEVTLFHTQTVGLFARLACRQRQYVLSVDATPRQMDALGRWYDHRVKGGALESLKARWYQSALKGAAAVVCWSEWAAESAVAHYGVTPDRVFVRHPGASSNYFRITRNREPAPRPTILFVGGDFTRKGGDLLLDAFQAVSDRAELVVVTEGEPATMPGIRVESGVRPNSARLHSLYQEADIFCLPTLADCTPIVLGEAMASGLPVITTRVGSNAETVRDATDGLLTEAGNVDDLRGALATLVDDAALRTRMGAAAREHANETFNSEANAAAIFDLLQEVAS